MLQVTGRGMRLVVGAVSLLLMVGGCSDPSDSTSVVTRVDGRSTGRIQLLARMAVPRPISVRVVIDRRSLMLDAVTVLGPYHLTIPLTGTEWCSEEGTVRWGACESGLVGADGLPEGLPESCLNGPSMRILAGARAVHGFASEALGHPVWTVDLPGTSSRSVRDGIAADGQSILVQHGTIIHVLDPISGRRRATVDGVAEGASSWALWSECIAYVDSSTGNVHVRAFQGSHSGDLRVLVAGRRDLSEVPRPPGAVVAVSSVDGFVAVATDQEVFLLAVLPTSGLESCATRRSWKSAWKGVR